MQFYIWFTYIFKGKQREAYKLDQNPPIEIANAYIKTGLSGDQKLLVLFLYNTSEEMRLTRMHPEMMQADKTHGTNKEKKELFTLASLDGNNCAFNAVRGFIPNAQKWVFTTLFADCLPKLFGTIITERN